jgi:cytochrome c biogenesis protein
VIDLGRRIGSDLYDFFTSVKLAVVLLTLIVLISLIGMFVPQRDWTREVDYVSRYGVQTYELLKTLQFDRVYSSWYFLFVLTLLTLNLIACTHKRLAASIRYFRLKQRPIPPDAYEKMEIQRTIALYAASPSMVQDKIAVILRKHFFRVRQEDGQLLGEKWRWERFGIDVFHVSLLLILAGGLLTATMTFRTLIIGHKGDIVRLQDDLMVRIDDFFSVNYKDSDRVMDWHSQLTVLEKNEPVASKVIQVNDPLTYRGFKFFQAAFGQDWMGAAEVTLRVTRTSDGVSLGEYQVKVDEGFEVTTETAGVPTEKLFGKVIAFLPHLDRAENGVFYSKTQRLENPAAFVTLVSEQGHSLYPKDCCWAFANAALNAEWKRLSAPLKLPYQMDLVGMKAPEFTGIQVKRDPGQPVAYLGFIILVIGISTHLFFKHKMVWVQVGPDQIRVAGMARNNIRQFEDEFAQIVSEFEKIEVEPPVLEPVNV